MDSDIVGVHHVGIAVKDIEEEGSKYVSWFGFSQETPILLEPPQKVEVQFFLKNEFRVELIQPTGDDSPILSFMEKGGVLNHICYETSDMEETVSRLRKAKTFFQTVQVTKASTLANCYYAFFAKPTGEVIELIYFDQSN